jgi:hypothetical protein
MKKSLKIFILIFSIQIINHQVVISQAFQIGHISMDFLDSDRNDRLIPVEVYYPALTTGEEVPVAPGQFPR